MLLLAGAHYDRLSVEKELDKTSDIRMQPKLKYMHLSLHRYGTKMKTSWAMPVLSHSMSAAIDTVMYNKIAVKMKISSQPRCTATFMINYMTYSVAPVSEESMNKHRP